MPRSIVSRAAARSFVAGGPQTRTSASVPSAAASSTARRLSASASGAAKNPPRQSEETFRPAASMRFTA
jgi:hypothetical protein